MALNIIDACRHPRHFGNWFVRGFDTWEAWFTFLKVVFGLMLNPDEREFFTKCTHRKKPVLRDKTNQSPFDEVYLIIGRRGGKSSALAIIGVYLACYYDWRGCVMPGQIPMVSIIAQDRAAARTILNFVKGLIKSSPIWSTRVVKESAFSIEINASTRICIEVQSASFKAVRSYTVVAALLDETAFWKSDESANPDKEVIRAIRPSLATVPGSLLLCASSPFVKRGVVYDAYQKYFGKDVERTLVWNCDSRDMNPLLRQAEGYIERAYAEDPQSAQTEYGARFRETFENPISRDMIQACKVPGRVELPPVEFIHYNAFIDPSGGSQDSMDLAITHFEKESGLIVLDLVRDTPPPFSPSKVVKEYAGILHQYRIKNAVGDAYGGSWPAEAFAKEHISYEVCPLSKSELYHQFIPILNSKRCELLDLIELEDQCTMIERRPSRTGRFAYDHPPGAHDDLANVTAGAIFLSDQLAPVPMPEATLGPRMRSAAEYVSEVDEYGGYRSASEPYDPQ